MNIIALFFVFVLNTLIFSMPASADSRSDFVTLNSDHFDGGRKFRIAVNRQSVVIDKGEMVKFNDDVFVFDELNRLLSANGVTTSVLKVASKYDVYFPYLIDSFLHQGGMSISSKMVNNFDGLEYFEVEASDARRHTVYGGISSGNDHFVIASTCSKRSGNEGCLNEARVTARSFELDSYLPINPSEKINPVVLGEIGVESIIPDSWSVSLLGGTPVDASALLIKAKGFHSYPSAIQIKGVMKKSFPSYDIEKMFDLAKREFSKEGLVVIQNISRSLMETSNFKGAIEAHVVSDGSGRELSYVLSVFEGANTLVSIKAVYPLLKDDRTEWMRTNTVLRKLVSNLRENRPD